MIIDWEKTFDNLKPQKELNIIQNLNEEGFILDENTFITRVMINEAFEKLKVWFLKNGYTGGELSVIGDFFVKYGSVYIIFDTKRMNHKEALFKLKQIYQ